VLRYDPCVTRRSHSFTCHLHTNHTCLYSQPQGVTALCTHCAYPRRDGQAELTCMGGWLHSDINVPHRELNLDTVTHPGTNRTRRRLTSLMETNAPPQRQTTTNLQWLKEAMYVRVVHSWLEAIGVDLAGLLGGRMASAEGGSVSSGMANGEGCPLSSRLRGLPGQKRILAYFEGHRTLIFVPIWQNLGDNLY